MLPVSSNIQVVISSDALKRCSRMMPIIHHSAGARAWHEHQCFMKFVYVSVVVQACSEIPCNGSVQVRWGVNSLCHGFG
jgi:hypothetical protein